MKLFAIAASIAAALSITPLCAAQDNTAVYVNQHVGFNVPGYKYEQEEFPCAIDKNLVQYIVENGRRLDLAIKPVGTAAEINNGTIPVIAMDIEQLVLSEDFQLGTKSSSPLPKVQVTAAVIRNQQMETAKHTCAIASLNEFTPSTSILDLGTVSTVCDAAQKCVKDLSKDIVEWAKPLVR